MNKTIQEFCPSAASPECKLNNGLDPLEAFEGLMIKCNAYQPFRIYSKICKVTPYPIIQMGGKN